MESVLCFHKGLWGVVPRTEDEFEGGARPEAYRPLRRRFELSSQKRTSIRISLVEAADLGNRPDVASKGSGGA